MAFMVYVSTFNMVALFLLFGSCCLTLTYAASCEDVDTQACKLLALKRPDLCSDECLSKSCTRYCGHCPVKCYECHEIDDPANCTTLVECPSKDHYCFTTQTFADDFTEAYKMGCAMKSVCQSYLGGSIGRRKKNVDVNAACCREDKCNNKLPLVISSAVIPITPDSTASTVNTTTDPNTCENLDDTACQRLLHSNIYACSDACFAISVCPRLCGRCFNCYTCNDIQRLNDCNTTHVCQPGHECFTLETLSFDLRPVFRVGCMEEQLCARFKVNTSEIFGKREGFALKGGCCKRDLCNDHIQIYHQPTTTTKPTHVCPSQHRHCPAGFHSQDQSCYMTGNQATSWFEAKKFCESHCSRLVDFSTQNEMINVLKLVVPNQNGQYQDARLWTGATFSSKHWVWETGHQVNSQQFSQLVGSSHSGSHHCGLVTVHTGSGSHHHTKEVIIAADCKAHYLPLCEITKH